MLKESNFKKVYFACGYTDLRFGVYGLAEVIRQRFNLEPKDENTLFVFCGRSSHTFKALLWEPDGFIMLYKRLENGKFLWPRKQEDLRLISSEELKRFLDGFAIDSSIKKPR